MTRIDTSSQATELWDEQSAAALLLGGWFADFAFVIS